MRARSYKPRKVNVVTLGCAKNIFDSEVMMAQLRANDFEVEHEVGEELLRPPLLDAAELQRRSADLAARGIDGFPDARTLAGTRGKWRLPAGDRLAPRQHRTYT